MLADYLRQLLQSPRFQEGSAWKRRLFVPGDVLVRAGSIGRSVFLIDTGVIAVVGNDASSAEGHREVELVKLRAGDVFGESTLIGRYKSIATVKAITEGEALEINGPKLSIYLDDRPDDGYLFYKYLLEVELEKLAGTNRGMVALALTASLAKEAGDSES